MEKEDVPILTHPPFSLLSLKYLRDSADFCNFAH
jgi:hypothetical protein